MVTVRVSNRDHKLFTLITRVKYPRKKHPDRWMSYTLVLIPSHVISAGWSASCNPGNRGHFPDLRVAWRRWRSCRCINKNVTAVIIWQFAPTATRPTTTSLMRCWNNLPTINRPVKPVLLKSSCQVVCQQAKRRQLLVASFNVCQFWLMSDCNVDLHRRSQGKCCELALEFCLVSGF